MRNEEVKKHIIKCAKKTFNKNLKEIRKSTDQNLIQFTAADLEKAQERRNTYAAIMAGGYTLGLIGTVFFTWSFIF